MKYLILFAIIITSCIQTQTPKKQETSLERKRPPQNDAILRRVNAQKTEMTIKQIKEIEETEKPQIPKEERTVSQSDFPKMTPYVEKKESPPQPPEPKNEVLEITGTYGGKSKNFAEVLTPNVSNAETKFLISTSPSYFGFALEEARQTLEQFGTVKAVRSGEKFSLKVFPRNGLETESEAREFMNKIISFSFYDVYVERAK